MAGFAAPGFEAVRDRFMDVSDGSGRQLAVYAGGELVVDLWSSPELPGDALTPVFSITKGATHLVAALLVQQGALELDHPVSATGRTIPPRRAGLRPCATCSPTSRD